MAGREVTLQFNTESKELWISFGDGKRDSDNLIIDEFVFDEHEKCYTVDLSRYHQGKIVKALVSNM
jgi:hypothetical protein